jgi:hypothetical protein
MLVAAMRAFERMSSVLRYREADKWHTCDMVGMREAIKAALAAAALRRPVAGAEAAPSISDSALWILASSIHDNVPLAERPASWSDFSPEQIDRLRRAATKFVAALSRSQSAGRP